MAFEVGAAEEGLGILEMLRAGPVGHEFIMNSDVENALVQPDLWVNIHGERFCDESIAFNDTYVGNANAGQTQRITYSVFDSAIKQHLIEKGTDKAMIMDSPPGSKVPGLERELDAAIQRSSTEIFVGDTIQELAGKMGINPETLQATVDEYNRYCEQGHDELFAKDPKYLRPIKVPKFYAIRARTLFLGTLGGIKINHRMEVLNKKDLVIPGLYAAGYDAGGMYGDGYSIGDSSGLSSAFAVNSGRIAGENALKYLGK
jgi:fumarate reductase flavoprotein subunit